MTITAQQREDRRRFIGSSDVPALFGRSPFKTAWDVWASKVHGIDSEPGSAAQMGDWLEPWLLDRYEDRTGVKVERGGTIVHPTCPVLAVNLDGSERDGERITRIIECKSHGIEGPARRSGEWGEPGTDEVPDDVMLQVQAQLECADCEHASVEVLMGGRGLLSYPIKRNRKLGRAIVRESERFWRSFVDTRVPPPDAAPRDASLARRLPMFEGLVLPIPDDMAGRYFALKHMRSLIDKALKSSEGELLAFLNGAPKGMTAWGDIELKPVAVKAYTVPDRVDIRLTSPRKASAEAFEQLVGSKQLPALIGGVEADEDE